MNITKIENGFSVDETPLKQTLQPIEGVEILSPTECHIPTEQGTFFYDITVTIDGQEFTTIEDWVAKLYKQV
jgi:hypothetical protein